MKVQRILTTALIALTLTLAAMPAVAQDDSGKKSSSKRAEKVVNINTADTGELALLPRVGPSLSARIVEYREANEKFEQPEDLMLVRGIGEKTFELMEPWIVVEGETTLTEKVSTAEALARSEPENE